MLGRTFLDVAKELVQGATEAHWRATVGRAYYALLLEGRDALERWGFIITRRDQVHAFVRLRFLYAADADLREVGRTLDWLGRLRNQADYQLGALGSFRDAAMARQAIHDAELHLAHLDKIEADSSRRAAVITDIRTRWP